MVKPGLRITGRNGREGSSEGGFQSLLGTGLRAAKVLLEFAEGRLDRSEVRRIGRQILELAADLGKQGLNFGPFVATEVIEDDDLAGLEDRDQHLSDVGDEGLAVERPRQRHRS